MEKIFLGQLYAIIPTSFCHSTLPTPQYILLSTCIWTLDIVQVMYTLVPCPHLALPVFDHFQYLDEAIDDVHILNLIIM